MPNNPFQPIMDLIAFITDPMGVNKLIDRKLPTGDRKKAAGPAPAPVKDTGPPTLPFVELAAKAINFQDDQKQPLIAPAMLQVKAGYQVNEKVTNEAVTSRVLDIFQEVAPRTANIEPAGSGRYARVPIPTVLMNASEEDLRAFLSYVDRFPKKYIGQEVRIANAFVAWVRAGAE